MKQIENSIFLIGNHVLTYFLKIIGIQNHLQIRYNFDVYQNYK